MDTLSAFAMGEMSRDRPLMVFDWLQAARYISQHLPSVAMAGLRGDEGATSGRIFADGKMIADDYTYLASTWAMPILSVTQDNGWLVLPCYLDEKDTSWDAHTRWPPEAQELLAAQLQALHDLELPALEYASEEDEEDEEEGED